MKEHPILFSTPMVKAILAGNKAQTRRIIKHQPYIDNDGWYVFPGLRPKSKYNTGYIASNCPPDEWEIYLSPYGNVGDVLWVRETWGKGKFVDEDGNKDYEGFVYKAGGYVFEDDYSLSDFRWKPSIFMPREACRIMLEITAIRIERLQDISEEDAKNEGVELYDNHDNSKGGWGAPCTYKESYALLWNKINGKESWDKNPWVWVIEFKKIKQ